MPRRRKLRKVVAPPKFKSFKPSGGIVEPTEQIEFLYEEYEAIKLADYDLLNHQEAADLMGVSRATFARIYEMARRKIAEALVEVKELKTVYGSVWLDNDWLRCTNCTAKFTIPSTSNQHFCPMCKSNDFKPIKNNQ